MQILRVLTLEQSSDQSLSRTRSRIAASIAFLFRTCFEGVCYAAPIGAFSCPEIRSFTEFWGEISSTVSKALSDRNVLFKHKNGG